MTVHVVGAGIAGLAASVGLVSRGERVILYEAAPQAGGRCRSYEDKALGRVIDNGNHLLLSGNGSTLDYLAAIGVSDGLVGPKEARYPFVDLKNGKRWEVQLDDGRLPLWVLDKKRRVPGSGFFSYLKTWRLAMAGEQATVADCLRSTGVLWERFWDPMSTAVLNTPPDIGSARLLWAAMKESFSRGGEACRPLIARENLAASLVDPALNFLTRHRADLYFGQRLRSIDLASHAERLQFGGLDMPLEPGDHVILALPPSRVADLLPGIQVPVGTHAIVNAHFRLPAPVRLLGKSMLLGMVNSVAQWLFLRDEMVSVTVSAADDLAVQPSEAIAATLWQETARALTLAPQPVPAYRIIKEKRATFSQTPAEIAKRPPTRTRWPNLHLAGDWTDTGLPATIEGAVRSGDRAAEAVLVSGAGGPGR